MAQLEVERKEYEEEMKRRQEMEEEQRLIAQQEAIEKAILEAASAGETEQPIPNVVPEPLETVTEGNEEEKKEEKGIVVP